jgi:multimeric flavodoxin WrbA
MVEQQKSERQLKNEGWKLASLTSGEHLKRTLEMYNELGIETYLFTVDPEKCGTCTKCYIFGEEKPYKIYIKKPEYLMPNTGNEIRGYH